MQHKGTDPAHLTAAIAENLEGGFGNILAGRRALLSSAQAPATPADRSDAAQAASEFGALKLFQNPASCAQQSVGYSKQATLPLVNLAEAELPNPNLVVPASELDPEAPEQTGLPDLNPAFIGNLVSSGVPGTSGVLSGQVATPANGSAIAAAPTGAALAAGTTPPVRRDFSRSAEPEVLALPGARRQASLPEATTGMTLGLHAEGKDAVVVSRVTGLSADEAEELQGRIRGELAASRLSAREIRINGRLPGPAQGRE